MADDDGTDPLCLSTQQFSRLLVLHELRHPWREAPYSKRKPEGPHYFPDRLETLFDSLPKMAESPGVKPGQRFRCTD